MKAVRAKMFSLMPSSMKSYGESAVTLRNEVELRMKMNSVRKMLDQNHSETKSQESSENYFSGLFERSLI